MSFRITVLSGGSGNDSLIRGLVSTYNDCDVKVIVNALDNGKSTGICRQVTNTLGVSDIRKNHSRMYESTVKNPNKSILEFYNKRFDFPNNSELEFILNMLNKWELEQFNEYAINFFNQKLAKNIEYKDFNIANIIYSQMYAELGYEKTNSIFCNLLGIDDFVILNSFDNVFLKGITENGNIIGDEGDLVEHKNPNDKICNVGYEGIRDKLNPEAIDRVLNSDLLIISTGTFWSSIYPTLDYLDFYKYINESKAKKIWAINNEEDKDAYGVTSNDFISYLENLGLNLSNFTILENEDSISTLHQDNDKYDIIIRPMGNNNGKHDGLKYARALLCIYYNLYSYYDYIICDFDDTIWSRQYKNESQEIKSLSYENIELLNSIKNINTLIISGNTYESIAKKLYEVYGTDLSNLNIKIWADSNCRLYYKNKEIKSISSLKIPKNDYNIIKADILSKFNLKCTVDNEDTIFNIKIKPLKELERKLLVEYLNSGLFMNALANYKATPTGTTTVDITHINNNKLEILKDEDLLNASILYIGDEIDSGNDRDIANSCDYSINVKSVQETNAILKLIKDIYIDE